MRGNSRAYRLLEGGRDHFQPSLAVLSVRDQTVPVQLLEIAKRLFHCRRGVTGRWAADRRSRSVANGGRTPRVWSGISLRPIPPVATRSEVRGNQQDE